MSGVPDPAFLRRLEEAVANLPRLQREIFLAHRLDGLLYADIAARTGLSVKRVKRLMADAICNIDRQMCGQRLRWWHRWF